MASKKKPTPAAPREVWLLTSGDRGFVGHVNYESEAEAKYAARTLYNDPMLHPVRYVPRNPKEGKGTK